MEIDKALEKIDQIYGHLAKGEVYRGYRPLPVALTGAVAIIGSLAQAWFLPDLTPIGFVVFWVAIAVASVGLVTAALLKRHVATPSVVHRRATWRVVCQLLPALTAGAAVTLLFGRFYVALIPLLPGFWALLFSLGIFASRPYLPRATGWVGLFYFVAGVVLLAVAETGATLSPLAMGATFGPGQLVSGLVLFYNLERTDNG